MENNIIKSQIFNQENHQNDIYFDGFIYVKHIKENIIIIKNINNNEFFIQKILCENKIDINIFRYLEKNHIPNFPNIIDIKRIDDGKFAIIKEYIDGTSLLDYLKNKKVDSKIFFELIYKICDIFIYLHSLPVPIIYRDLKPENIIIKSDLKPYIIDMDSMIFYDPKKEHDEHRKGTEGYASPEQYGFQSSSPASDIYTIGSLIKHILPFFENNKLNKKMEPVVEKCCKMDPKDRYKNIKQLKNEIYKREHNFRLLAIPGFRNDNDFHMIVALLYYGLIFYYCFFKTEYKSLLLSLISYLYIIFVSFIALNYLGVYRLMPLTKSKNIFIKTIGVVLLTTISAFILFKMFVFIYIRISLVLS